MTFVLLHMSEDAAACLIKDSEAFPNDVLLTPAMENGIPFKIVTDTAAQVGWALAILERHGAQPGVG